GHKANGRAVVTAIAAAYEVFCRFADEISLKGWDQGMFAAIGAACGAGMILGLDRKAMANAISIAITTGVPLGVTRIGQLSMWNGGGSPNRRVLGRIGCGRNDGARQSFRGAGRTVAAPGNRAAKVGTLWG